LFIVVIFITKWLLHVYSTCQWRRQAVIIQGIYTRCCLIKYILIVRRWRVKRAEATYLSAAVYTSGCVRTLHSAQLNHRINPRGPSSYVPSRRKRLNVVTTSSSVLYSLTQIIYILPLFWWIRHTHILKWSLIKQIKQKNLDYIVHILYR
jgi:hypothetical protein